MFNLSAIYSARKSSNHILSQNHKISPDTNSHKKLKKKANKQTNETKQNKQPPQPPKKHKHQTQNFRRISPFGIVPVKKAHKARTRWYRGPFRRKIKMLYKYITANTSAIRQHAAHTTDQLLAAKQVPYKKAYLMTKNIEGFSGKSSEKWSSRQKKR